MRSACLSPALHLPLALAPSAPQLTISQPTNKPHTTRHTPSRLRCRSQTVVVVVAVVQQHDIVFAHMRIAIAFRAHVLNANGE